MTYFRRIFLQKMPHSKGLQVKLSGKEKLSLLKFCDEFHLKLLVVFVQIEFRVRDRLGLKKKREKRKISFRL